MKEKPGSRSKNTKNDIDIERILAWFPVANFSTYLDVSEFNSTIITAFRMGGVSPLIFEHMPSHDEIKAVMKYGCNDFTDLKSKNMRSPDFGTIEIDGVCCKVNYLPVENKYFAVGFANGKPTRRLLTKEETLTLKLGAIPISKEDEGKAIFNTYKLFREQFHNFPFFRVYNQQCGQTILDWNTISDMFLTYYKSVAITSNPLLVRKLKSKLGKGYAEYAKGLTTVPQILKYITEKSSSTIADRIIKGLQQVLHPKFASSRHPESIIDIYDELMEWRKVAKFLWKIMEEQPDVYMAAICYKVTQGFFKNYPKAINSEALEEMKLWRSGKINTDGDAKNVIDAAADLVTNFFRNSTTSHN